MSDEAWEDAKEEARLTAALRSYAVTSPRQGLEARMLAHVDTASKPQVRFVWLLGPALALLAMVSVLVPYGRRSPHPPTYARTDCVDAFLRSAGAASSSHANRENEIAAPATIDGRFRAQAVPRDALITPGKAAVAVCFFTGATIVHPGCTRSCPDHTTPDQCASH